MVAAFTAAVGSAMEFGGRFHGGFHGRFRGGFLVGGVGELYGFGYPYPPYAYAYAYPYSYAVPNAPVVAPASPPQDFWYFCRPANAYYPYVSSCSAPWQQVPTRPR
jgi:hypothetical protein